MESDKTKIHVAVTFIGFILLFVGLFLVLMRVDTYLRYKGIDDGAKISRYETTDKNAKVTYPITDMYESCLEEKGNSK
ncbi:MAG: hypothetical protein HYV40_05555 [Candidatus Levybacteria bacterium]|nr:hypothetical protein [Candidatus Levybacteria bacterium]